MRERKNCVVCGKESFGEIFTLKEMPVYMGVNKGFDEYFSDMTFLECSECKNVQIKEIIEPEKIYVGNHNLSVVGPTWENHYIEFINLLDNFVKDLVVIEIGDPSFKISSKLSKDTKSWIIVELNPNEKIGRAHV